MKATLPPLAAGATCAKPVKLPTPEGMAVVKSATLMLGGSGTMFGGDGVIDGGKGCA